MRDTENDAWLRMNDKENALDSLFRAAEHIERVGEHEFHWKWVIMCLHNSLYTFTLTYAAGTNYRSVMRKQREFRAIDFVSAIKRCIETQKRYNHSIPFELSRDQKNSVLCLGDFRNSFAHFSPVSRSIELVGMPNICIHVLEAIRFLALDCGEVSYHLESEKYYRKRSQGRFCMSREHCNELKKQKIKESIANSIAALKSSEFYTRDNLIGKRSDLSKLP